MKYGACKNCGDIGPLGLNDTCSEGCEPVRNGLPVCSSPDYRWPPQVNACLREILRYREQMIDPEGYRRNRLSGKSRERGVKV